MVFYKIYASEIPVEYFTYTFEIPLVQWNILQILLKSHWNNDSIPLEQWCYSTGITVVFHWKTNRISTDIPMEYFTRKINLVSECTEHEDLCSRPGDRRGYL